MYSIVLMQDGLHLQKMKADLSILHTNVFVVKLTNI